MPINGLRLSAKLAGSGVWHSGQALIPVDVPQSVAPAKEFPFAIGGATDRATGYACPTVVENVTILGRVRAATIEGAGKGGREQALTRRARRSLDHQRAHG